MNVLFEKINKKKIKNKIFFFDCCVKVLTKEFPTLKKNLKKKGTPKKNNTTSKLIKIKKEKPKKITSIIQ